MNANPKTLKARIGAVVKATENFDAPAPPRPPPPHPLYPFARDRPHDPFGFQWLEVIPDLAVLDGHLPSGVDVTGLRFVSRLELHLIRSAGRAWLRQNPLPILSATHPVIRVDSRRRFAGVSYPDSAEYLYITTCPYPTWLADDALRNTALTELPLSAAGI